MNDQLRRQLEVAEAEDAFVAAKDKHDRDSAAYRKAKEHLAEVRGAYRRDRQANADEGGAVASPDSIKATAGERK